jgi:hypothetical protein
MCQDECQEHALLLACVQQVVYRQQASRMLVFVVAHDRTAFYGPVSITVGEHRLMFVAPQANTSRSTHTAASRAY